MTLNIHAQNIDVRFLGNNYAAVKVGATNLPYLMLPIEESAPEAKINVLLNGKIDRQINVRLAQNKVDYLVPFQLKAYKGHPIVLDVETYNDRSGMRDIKNDLCWRTLKLSDKFSTENTEKYRPAYHHTPLYGWMNDPNGMFYHNGRWHLYYQWNPYASLWANMTWGHSSSTDLIHWTHHDDAIQGDGLGAIFSGSAVVDKNNTAGFGKDAAIAIYTSASATQKQSLAYSTDEGMTFTKFDGNPIISDEKECRDPNFFWNEQTHKWNLVLANSLGHQDWFFESTDLKTWTKTGEFGEGYGAQEGVWECPDLMELPVIGTKEKKWVLIVNINPGGKFGGSATQYFTGDFDGKVFRCDTPKPVTKWMDFGKDHYATVSWSNAPEGRHTVIAWMSNWQYANIVPTKQYRSANSLPRDLKLYKAEDGNYYLHTEPSPEVLSLRGTKTSLGSMKRGEKRLPVHAEGLYEINLTAKGSHNSKLDITLKNDHGDQVVLTYDFSLHTFAMDRTKSGIVDFSSDFPCTTVAPTSHSLTQNLRLFIDRSSIEAFDGEGRWVMTNLVFPNAPYNIISVNKRGDASVQKLTVYNIKK